MNIVIFMVFGRKKYSGTIKAEKEKTHGTFIEGAVCLFSEKYIK